jgi:hypothetical protein
MGYQPRTRSPKGSVREPKKALYEKGKYKKRLHSRIGRPALEEKHIATEKEVSELTLKRLHILGKQKFGSSPFSEHFDRWLTDVEVVLGEFESNPNINADEQFVMACSQTLSGIKQQLEVRRHREAALDQELRNLSDWRSRLKQVNKEYASSAGALKSQKNREIKRLYCVINRLKLDQDEVIRMKTGFFHGVSKKKREQKEIAIVQELTDKQNELELVMLDFSGRHKEMRADYGKKREPVLEEIKKFRKIIQALETDGSLEERWFACEALIDLVNTFLQGKASLPK